MRNMVKISVAALSLALATSTALAEHFYAAGDVGMAKASDTCTGLGVAGVAGCNDTTAPWRVSAGYEFTPNWAAEVGYADYGYAAMGVATAPMVFHGSAVAAGTSLGQWHATGYEFALVGTLPLRGRLAGFARLGGASTRIDLTGPGTRSITPTLAWGLGARYTVTRTFAIRAQYERLGVVGDYANTGKTSLAQITAGIVLKL